MIRYRDKKGRFTTQYNFERTYGDLTDPEVKEAIRDISGNPPLKIVSRIKNRYYVVWLVCSTAAVWTAFWLGTVVYSKR